MRTHFIKTVTNAVKHWYVPLIVGLLFLALGIYVFATPVSAYLTLAFIFSLSFLFSGFSEVAFALVNRNELDNWGWTLISGIVSLVLGGVLLAHPEISVAALSYYIGFVVLFRSFMAISTALDMRHYNLPDWGTLLFLGILGLIFSGILLWNPVFAGMTLVFWTAAAFVAIGIFNIYLSLRLKKLHNLHDSMPEELKERYHRIKIEMKEEMEKRKQK